MISLKINNFNRVYIAVKTNAPKSYDYSGVIRLNIPCYGECVLIDNEQMDYQLGRYISGLYRYDTLTSDDIPEIQEALYQKIIKGD